MRMRLLRSEKTAGSELGVFELREIFGNEGFGSFMVELGEMQPESDAGCKGDGSRGGTEHKGD